MLKLLFFLILYFGLALTNNHNGSMVIDPSLVESGSTIPITTTAAENNDGNSIEFLYSLEDILKEMQKETEQFYEEFISARKMLPKEPSTIHHPEFVEDDEYDEYENPYLNQARRRRRRFLNYDNDDDERSSYSRIADSFFVPDFIRDGIQLISQIVPIEDENLNDQRKRKRKLICPNQNGFIIDFFILKSNQKQYVLCLIKLQQSPQLFNYSIFYGTINNDGSGGSDDNNGKLYQFELKNMLRPKKLLAFVDSTASTSVGTLSNQQNEVLVVLVINEKRTIDEFNIKWLQISSKNNQIIYQNHLKSLKRISYRNVGLFSKRNMLLVHDIFESRLKIFKFVRTYFDLVEYSLPIQIDLNAICTYTLNGISYVVLGFREDHSNNHLNPNSYKFTPKDVQIYQYNDYLDRLELLQSIQCSENVLQIEYFFIGHGINQENFLTIVEERHIVLYKFLKSKREFLIFQRLPFTEPIRMIRSYGDNHRKFVMIIILESNDIYFITYNSLRFIFSPINIRLYVNHLQPIRLEQINRKSINPDENNVQLMIGGYNGIRLYDIRFFRDNNLFKLWTEHLQWCHHKRTEILELEKHITIVQKRYHESYLRTEPLIIHGTLSVPNYHGTVIEAQEYRTTNTSEEFALNAEYFQRLSGMKNHLQSIEQRIQLAHEKLSKNAIQINSAHVQQIYGNFSFQHLSMLFYRGNNNHHPATMNLITSIVNGQNIQDLFSQVIQIIQPNQLMEVNHEQRIMNPIYFKTIQLINSNNDNSGQLFINCLCNERYNLSNIVTINTNHEIYGRKRFHKILIVDDSIESRLVDDKIFQSETVLLTNGEQLIRNPIHVISKKLRAGQLNTINVNNEDFGGFQRSVVKLNEPLPLNVRVEFQQKLIVDDLQIDSGAKLNGMNLEQLYNEALWLNNDRTNQTIFGDFRFNSNLTIMADLFVRKINNRMVPEDFIRPNDDKQFNSIIGEKVFHDQVFVKNLNVSQSLNGLVFMNGSPDIVIQDIEQNITGKKSIPNVSVRQSSIVRGLLNGLNLAELNKRSQQRPKIRHFQRLHVQNLARFEGGLWFDQINSINSQQFHRLVHESLKLDDSWSNSNYDHVHFAELHVNYLDCDSINGLDPINGLLTTATTQHINLAPMITFQNDLILEDASQIDTLNDFKFQMLNDVLNKWQNQTVNGTKEIYGDLFVNTLHLNSMLNDIPVDDIVFDNWNDTNMYEDTMKFKPIVGTKHFIKNLNNQSLKFESIIIDDLIVESINGINLNDLFENSLRRRQRQNISNRFSFNTLIIKNQEDLSSTTVNDVNLQWLKEDVVFASRTMNNDLGLWQNVTTPKIFKGNVQLNQLEFNNLLDGVTVYEMKHGWLVNNYNNEQWSSNHRIRANFSIDQLFVENNVHVHDSHMNGLNLDWFVNDVVWLDKKTSILSELEFNGNVKINGNILLNGRLNEIDLRKDLVLQENGHNSGQLQTIKGHIRFVNNVTIRNDLDVNGLINRIDLKLLCGRVFKPNPQRRTPLVINGNVQFIAPAQFDLINGLNFEEEINRQALRHDRNDQKIHAKKLIDVLVLDGPTMVNRFLNNLDLEMIFENYLSLTRDQVVETELILKNVRFTKDVHVDQINSDSDIINGVNLGQINQNSLRQTGDQIYNGNIHFNGNVDVDLDLNFKWINGIAADYLWNKKRLVNTFTEEITFTQDLHVRNNANVVQGKKLANVHIDRILKDAVLQNSHRNYTIYGQKTFDNVEIYILHTRPLNNVTFSRENLLLKRFDQTITGKTQLIGDVWINKTLAVDKINDFNLVDLKRRLVKKQRQDNIIRTRVRVRNLVIKNAHVRSFIDNVNLTILDQFANTTNLLRNLDQELRQTRSQLTVLQNNLQTIGSRLIYFEQLKQIHPMDLFLTQMPTPLAISHLDHWICVFLPIRSWQSEIIGCNQVRIYCNTNEGDYFNRTWHHSFTFYYPGHLLSFEQVDTIWLLASNINRIPGTKLNKCLQQNQGQYPNSSLNDIGQGAGLWFQSVRFLMATKQFILNYHPMNPSESTSVESNYNFAMGIHNFHLKLNQNPSVAFVSHKNQLNLIHIGHVDQIKLYLSNERTFQMSGDIQMIYHFNDLVLIAVSNNNYQSKESSGFLEIYTLRSNYQLYRLSMISNVRPKSIVMIENYQLINNQNYNDNNGFNISKEFKNFIIIQEYESKKTLVFGTTDGLTYSKTQEINSGYIKSNLQIYSFNYDDDIKNGLMEQNLLMLHTCEYIHLYRLYGLEGFRLEYSIKIDETVQIVLQSSSYLYLFQQNRPCYNELIINESIQINNENHLKILKPQFRKLKAIYNQTMLIEDNSMKSILLRSKLLLKNKENFSDNNHTTIIIS